jgi:hypothetical protein
MQEFESEFFEGSSERTPQGRRYGEGFEPRPVVSDVGFSVTAWCKTCLDDALPNVAGGVVQLKCRRCDRSEFVARAKMDKPWLASS